MEKNKAKTKFDTLSTADTRSTSPLVLIDSTTLRENNYKSWLAGKEFNRIEQQHLQILEHQTKQLELEKELMNRRQSSEINYKHWKATKKPLLKNKLIQVSYVKHFSVKFRTFPRLV